MKTIQHTIDDYFWRPVWHATEYLLTKKAERYSCCRILHAVNEAAWCRMTGGPQSFFFIFKCAMGWHKRTN